MPEENPNKTKAIVIDLDGTILDRSFHESLRLYLISSPLTGRVFPDAVSALTTLSDRVKVVGVTARCKRGEANTRLWLKDHGLEAIRALHSPGFLVNEPARVRFKRGAINSLKQEGLHLLYGVGDRGSDLDAYVEEGLFPIMVTNKREGKRFKALQIRITERGLVQDKDYVLFDLEGSTSSLWSRVQEFLLQNL